MGERCRTRYPIVLVHGLLGFVRVAGYSYWHGIDAALRRQGAAVHVVRLFAMHDNEALGEQLLERVAAIRAASGAGQFDRPQSGRPGRPLCCSPAAAGSACWSAPSRGWRG